jgi:DNA-binding GntR family transcriptional regulator
VNDQSEGGLGLGSAEAPTLGTTVLEILRASILSGRFAPGERLVEAELSRELGVSRGPIREALALLEGDGLVESISRRGKYVRTIDEQLVDETYSLRRILDVYAVELAIARLSGSSLEGLRLAMDRLREAVASGDRLAVAERDIDFHEAVYIVADHELLRRIWKDQITGSVRLLVNMTTPKAEDLFHALHNHELIVEAIATADVDTARRLTEEHVDDAWALARRILKQHAAETADGDTSAGAEP